MSGHLVQGVKSQEKLSIVPHFQEGKLEFLFSSDLKLIEVLFIHKV